MSICDITMSKSIINNTALKVTDVRKNHFFYKNVFVIRSRESEIVVLWMKMNEC